MKSVEMPETNQPIWIAASEALKADAAPFMRREFRLPDTEIASAELAICGLGYYEAWIDGRRVGDHLLDPAQTDYETRCLYAVHDVADLLRTGENAIGVILGNGFYNQTMVPEQYGWLGEKMSYGPPCLWLRLEVESADGERHILTTDGLWRCTVGPILANNVYAGEEYDARLEIPGWAEPDFPGGAGWHPVRTVPGPGGRLEEQRMPPIRATVFLRPTAVTKPDCGRYVVDLGQNIAGWARIRVRGEAGTRISMRFAETINGDGSIDTASTGVFATSVEQTDVYTCRGDGFETWEPRFTYHGFRYVEIEGWPLESAPPEPDDITGVMVHTDLPSAGNFSCSNSRLNKLHRMALYTHRSNLHSIPEDCPARERCGWLGDAHIVCEYSLYNFDGEAFWLKYLDDMETTRARFDGLPRNIAPGRRDAGRARPDWMAAMILIPWYIYLYRGKRNVLVKHRDGMCAVMEHFIENSEEGLLKGGYGDWFDPGEGPQPSHTPEELTTTIWFYECCRIMAETERILGHSPGGKRNGERNSEEYEELRDTIRSALQKKYFDADRCSFGSQTADAMTLHYDLVPSGCEQSAANAMADDIHTRGTSHTAGIMGIRYLFESLTEYGHGDRALTLMCQDAYPSFGNLIQRGATTLWEYWGEPEVDKKCGPRSLSHSMMGGFDNWFYNTLGGIRPDPERPGFEHIILRPYPIQGLDWVSTYHDGPRGRIGSAWKWEDSPQSGNGPASIVWEVTVPPDSTATAILPISRGELTLPPGTHRLQEPIPCH
jgi:alpha-L-rhamnosidase